MSDPPRTALEHVTRDVLRATGLTCTATWDSDALVAWHHGKLLFHVSVLEEGGDRWPVMLHAEVSDDILHASPHSRRTTLHVATAGPELIYHRDMDSAVWALTARAVTDDAWRAAGVQGHVLTRQNVRRRGGLWATRFQDRSLTVSGWAGGQALQVRYAASRAVWHVGVARDVDAAEAYYILHGAQGSAGHPPLRYDSERCDSAVEALRALRSRLEGA